MKLLAFPGCAGAVLMLALTLCGLASGQGLSRYEMAGRAVASEFAWKVRARVAAAGPGAGTIQFDPSWLTLRDGTSYEPWQPGVPVRIEDGSATETVTLTGSDCTISAAGPCQATANFQYAHSGRMPVASGSDGLQEAVDYMQTRGGGTVLVTPNWSGPPRAITAATGSAAVQIEDQRNGADIWYGWSGGAYAAAAGVNLASPGWSGREIERTVYADQFCSTPGQLDASCLANAASDDTRVVLPAGTYHFAGQLTLNNLTNAVVEGQGPATVIEADGSAIRCNNCSGVVFKDLALVSTTVPTVVTPAQLPTANPGEVIAIDRWGTGQGYIPTVNDNDLWASLSTAQQQESFDTGLVIVDADRVRITGISGTYYSILFYDSSHCEVDHNQVMGGKNFTGAIAFWQGSSTTAGNHYDVIADNVVSLSAFSGIFIGGGSHYVVTGNTVSDAGESGIKTGQGSGQQATDAVVADNTVTRSWFDGLDLSSNYPHTAAFAAYSVAIGNSSADNHATGVYMDGKDWTVSDNSFEGNGLTGMFLDLQDSSVTGNVLTGNNTQAASGVNQMTVGGAVAPTGDVVSGNEVTSGTAPGYSIYLGGAALLAGNTVSGAGIYVPQGAQALSNVVNGQPLPDTGLAVGGTLTVTSSGAAAVPSATAGSGLALAGNYLDGPMENDAFNTNIQPAGSNPAFAWWALLPAPTELAAVDRNGNLAVAGCLQAGWSAPGLCSTAQTGSGSLVLANGASLSGATLDGTTINQGSLGGAGSFDFSAGTLREPASYTVGGATVSNPTQSGQLAITSQLPLRATAEIGGTAIPAGSCQDTSVSLPGATTSMVAAVSPGPLAAGWSGLSWSAYVPSGGTLTVHLCNSGSATVSPATVQVQIAVLP